MPGRLATIQRHTRAARRLTSDPVWRAVAAVPYAGRSLRAGTGLARAVDDLATTTLPDADLASRTLDPSVLRPSGDTIALEPFATALPPLERVRDSVAATEAKVRGLPRSFVLPVVRDARTDLLGQLSSLRSTSESAVAAARVTPAMLGRDGPRRYFLAILNNAEMRGSGGLLGAYGILEADKGKLRMLRLGTNAELHNTTPVPAVELDADFVGRYRRFSADSFWVNGNMSPHFPYASAVWTALWAKTHNGQKLDGTIAVDPIALSGILGATGPAVLPSGETINADNVVGLTESEAYIRFAKDNNARDRYLQQVARAAYERLVAADDTAALLRALGSAAGGRHLQLASEHPEEQAAFASLPVAGVLPVATEQPFLEVVTQNAGGNKLDYYLRRAVTYTRGRSDEARVEIRLRNVAPPGLPSYVSDRQDLPGNKPLVPGQHRVYLSVFCGASAGLLEATVNGAPLPMESEVERGHPVFSSYVDVDPGRDLVVVLRLRETGPGSLTLRAAPTVVPDDVRVS